MLGSNPSAVRRLSEWGSQSPHSDSKTKIYRIRYDLYRIIKPTYLTKTSPDLFVKCVGLTLDAARRCCVHRVFRGISWAYHGGPFPDSQQVNSKETLLSPEGKEGKEGTFVIY